jgi:hypothetical protein
MANTTDNLRLADPLPSAGVRAAVDVPRDAVLSVTLERAEVFGGAQRTWRGAQVDAVLPLFGLHDLKVSEGEPLGVETGRLTIHFRYEGREWRRSFELYADTLMRDSDAPSFYYTAHPGIGELLGPIEIRFAD